MIGHYSRHDILSSCCHAPVNVGGIPDFPKDDKPVTCYYKCNKCGMPCNISSKSILKQLFSIVKKTPKRVKSKRRNK